MRFGPSPSRFTPLPFSNEVEESGQLLDWERGRPRPH